MPAFAYRAASASGRTVRGVEEAESAPALERQLGARGLYPLHVAPASAADAEPRRAGFRGRRADVVEAVRYLATLLEAGFPLDRALGAVARVVARQDVAQAVADARERVRGGARLEQAMAAHPRIFPRFAVGMVRAGERGGHLAQALDRLAGQMEREQALRSRLASAMVYPAVMLAVGAGALAVLFVYVLPRFVALLEDTGSTLPKSTATLLAAGRFVSDWWMAIILVLAALVGGFAAWRGTDEGRAATDRILLGVPVIGGLKRRAAAARLGRSLSTLLSSGLPILPALEVAAESQADAAVAAEVLRVREEVRAGDRLAPSLRRTGIFPFVFVQMVDVGEESGRLPEMLDRMLRLLEPLLIVVFGGIVGFVALSLLQAIYGIRADAF